MSTTVSQDLKRIEVKGVMTRSGTRMMTFFLLSSCLNGRVSAHVGHGHSGGGAGSVLLPAAAIVGLVMIVSTVTAEHFFGAVPRKLSDLGVGAGVLLLVVGAGGMWLL